MIAPDPQSISWIRLIVASAVVFTLLVFLGLTLKYIKEKGFPMPGMAAVRAARRLQIVESLPLDVRRRLVIVRCDETEHLLLLGLNQDILVEARLNENQPASLKTKSTT